MDKIQSLNENEKYKTDHDDVNVQHSLQSIH